jgi:hypothetical protein
MEAQVVTPGTPPAVEQLVSQLQSDCGSGATIDVVGENSQQKFTIMLVSKKQRLQSVCRQTGLDIIQLLTKRSGAYVRTQIDVKVIESSTLNLATR